MNVWPIFVPNTTSYVRYLLGLCSRDLAEVCTRESQIAIKNHRDHLNDTIIRDVAFLGRIYTIKDGPIPTDRHWEIDYATMKKTKPFMKLNLTLCAFGDPDVIREYKYTCSDRKMLILIYVLHVRGLDDLVQRLWHDVSPLADIKYEFIRLLSVMPTAHENINYFVYDASVVEDNARNYALVRMGEDPNVDAELVTYGHYINLLRMAAFHSHTKLFLKLYSAASHACFGEIIRPYNEGLVNEIIFKAVCAREITNDPSLLAEHYIDISEDLLTQLLQYVTDISSIVDKIGINTALIQHHKKLGKKLSVNTQKSALEVSLPDPNRFAEVLALLVEEKAPPEVYYHGISRAAQIHLRECIIQLMSHV